MTFFKKAIIKIVASLVMAATMMLAAASGLHAETLLLQSTTSTLHSGLYNALLPEFTADTNIQVNVIAVGTGKALANGRNCNGDALLIHSTADELQFVSDGFGLYRKDVMYNDFVLIGPSDDPAQIAQSSNAAQALQAIKSAKAPFASRGDDSGTHKTEMKLWQLAAYNPLPDSGSWYLETGTGMGATLNLAVEKQAYALSDRATWLAFGNKQTHQILFEGDEKLFNQYGIIPIASAACPRSKQALAIRFADWIISHRGQAVIAAFENAGNQLFVPNAR